MALVQIGVGQIEMGQIEMGQIGVGQIGVFSNRYSIFIMKNKLFKYFRLIFKN
jgi:hypothetical protein